ncbi:MAG: hypothetical protein DRJ98_06970 [Thermoprotei archaeon]|nr:MAG: hypothetical protein DRJ98_06970 [Thermoprotei archaeon]
MDENRFSQMDDLPLEEKVKMLENSLKEIREPIENTLVDLRRMLSDLENPFNLLLSLRGDQGKGVQRDENQAENHAKNYEAPKPTGSESAVPGTADSFRHTTTLRGEASLSSINEPSTFLETPDMKLDAERNVKAPLDEDKAMDLNRSHPSVDERHLAVIACASLLLSLFDEDELRWALNSYVAKGWVSRRTSLMIKEALEMVPSILKSPPDATRRARMEDHLLAVYLLNKLDEGADERFFLALLLLSGLFSQKLLPINSKVTLGFQGDDKLLEDD